MPNHDLESLQARTSRGAFFTPAPKRGATGRKKGGGHRPIRCSRHWKYAGVSWRDSHCGVSAKRPECRVWRPYSSGGVPIQSLRNNTRAREDQADAHVEEMLDVARQAVNAKSSEEVQGYKLLVDTLKWRASKMKPRSYGDKLTLEGEVSVRQMTDEQLNARLAYLLGHRPGAVQGDPPA